MSPKIVDKTLKRREIVLSCYELIHEKGIRGITVDEVAKKANIAKGTVYEYFENKDDIIFEIISMHIQEYHNQFLKSIKDVKNTKDKIFHFFNFVLDDSIENLKHFNGFKDYLSIILSKENEQMKQFNSECHAFFYEELQKIISEGIKNGELIPQALDMSRGLLIFEKGLIVLKMTEKDFDVRGECERFINNFFNLIEIKK